MLGQEFGLTLDEHQHVDDKFVRERPKTTTDKRQYFREKRQRYRQKERDEIEWLRLQVGALEAHARGLQAVAPLRHRSNSLHELQLRDLALSWRDIATQFKREYRATAAEHAELVKRLQAQNELNRAMVHFVMKTESIPASLSTPFRLHNIPLSAHPLHRKFSMGDATVYTWPVPVRFILRHHMNEIASTPYPLEAIEWTENTVLYRAKVTQNPDSCISLLQAQFQEADRCIFVLRQVEADELYTVPLHKIYNAAWMDLRRVPDGRTLSRTVNLVSTHLVESGMGSLDEFAKVYDVDTSLSEEEDKVEVLQKALV
ncbi:hypothetical protein Ae201684_011459 [Aphanomyces euteiches]|uniref:BZIP domain-containing protein n=1 Tax=Aphanomyces euteiches TaxID=100861 RepID=A0A6G0WUR3_9STRA|nr:hypothetical protein Ae201684_011459 [Aphanomyces euteiches]